MRAPALCRGVANASLPWLLAGGVGAFAAGFVWFVASASLAGDAPAHTDGIVVLTGGAERVDTGLRLLAAGRADRLLVSGVAHGAELSALAHLAGIDPAPLAARVTLGHAASTTSGNAAETAAWAQRYGVHSLIVVTGFYHMPRALAELTRAMPGNALYRQPVMPPSLRGARLASLRLLLGEYVKYIAVRSGLTRALPADPGQPAVPAIAQIRADASAGLP